MNDYERQIFAKLREEPGNKNCIDCGAANPQWASECSGVHRSLGSHISFVRSVTMDSWSEKQLKKMMVGGNAACAAFFKQYGISMNTPIKEKYSSKAAEIYKERIAALAEGKDWKPPPNLEEILRQKPASSSPSLTRSNSSSPAAAKKSTSSSRKKDDDDWGWGEDTAPSSSSSGRKSGVRESPKQDSYRSSSSSYGSGYNSGYNSYNSSSNYGSGSDSNSNRSKQRSISSDEYFGNTDSYNNNKSKQRSISSDEYFGTGSSNNKQSDDMGDFFKTFETGLSKLSSAALVAADKLKQSTSDLSTKVQQRNWSEDMASISSKIADTSSKGWGLLQDYISKARDSVSQLASDGNTSYPSQSSSEYNSRSSDERGKYYNSAPQQSAAPVNNQPTPDLEDWLNEDDEPAPSKSKKSSNGKKKASAEVSNSDWDQWEDSTPSTTAASKSSAKNSSANNGSKDSWDNWDEEW